MSRGNRSAWLAILAVVLMGWLGWIAGPEHITGMGATFGAVGTTVALILGARAANKWQDRLSRGPSRADQ